MIIGELFLATMLLWVFFIAVATLKNKLFDKEAHILVRIPFYLIGAIFLVFDIYFNKTYGMILFWEFGHWKDLTLTSRLKRILHEEPYPRDSWRFKLAKFMCYKMVEPWDPDHCSLSKL